MGVHYREVLLYLRLTYRKRARTICVNRHITSAWCHPCKILSLCDAALITAGLSLFLLAWMKIIRGASCSKRSKESVEADERELDLSEISQQIYCAERRLLTFVCWHLFQLWISEFSSNNFATHNTNGQYLEVYSNNTVRCDGHWSRLEQIMLIFVHDRSCI